MLRMLGRLLCKLGYHKLTTPALFPKKVWFDAACNMHETPAAAIQFCKRRDCDHVEKLEVKLPS